MKLGKFLDNFLSSGSREITSTINGLSYETFGKILALSKYLDFDCDFGDDGLCRVRRKYTSFREKDKMCCCKTCRVNVGYLNKIPNSVEILRKYARSFNDTTGFWRKGKGCILPRSLRSTICVTFTCSDKPPNPAQSHLKEILHGWGGSSIINNTGLLVIDGKHQPTTLVPIMLEKWLKKEAKKETADENNRRHE